MLKYVVWLEYRALKHKTHNSSLIRIFLEWLSGNGILELNSNRLCSLFSWYPTPVGVDFCVCACLTGQSFSGRAGINYNLTFSFPVAPSSTFQNSTRSQHIILERAAIGIPLSSVFEQFLKNTWSLSFSSKIRDHCYHLLDVICL